MERALGNGGTVIVFAVNIGRRHELLYEFEHILHRQRLRRLARRGELAIVIPASDMCSGGRVVNYLKAMLHVARHDVLFVGCRTRGTPGAAILTYEPSGGYVDLDAERIAIRAEMRAVSGYSAHAKQDGLVRFVTRMRHLPTKVRLIHGDDHARSTLAERLLHETGGAVSVLNDGEGE